MPAVLRRVRAELRQPARAAVLPGDQVPPDPHDRLPAGAEGQVRQGAQGGAGDEDGEDLPALRAERLPDQRHETCRPVQRGRAGLRG